MSFTGAATYFDDRGVQEEQCCSELAATLLL